MLLRFSKRAFICSLLMGTIFLGGCGSSAEEDEVEPVVVDPVNLSIPYNNTFTSAENVGIQFSNFIRNGRYDYAFDLMDVPQGVLFNRQDLENVEQQISELPENYILAKVSSSDTSVTLTYGEKIGEAFSKAKKDTPSEYLGEVITYTYKVKLPISHDGQYANMIGVPSDYLTDDSIYFHAPDFVEVWIGGKQLDDTSRDDNGYYCISDFANGDTLYVKLVSDVESRELNLNIKADLVDEKHPIPDEERDFSTEYPNVMYNGEKAWYYTWDTSRITNNEAMEWVPTGVQAVFDSIINNEEFYNASFHKIMSKDANFEALKPNYVRIQNNFQPTKSKSYSDLNVISIDAWDEQTLKRKGISFQMLDKHTMSLWVTLKYSYVVTDINGNRSVKTNTVEGEIDVSKDDGEWKLMGISDKIMKGL